MDRVNRLLVGTFRGTILLRRVGLLRLDRIEGVDVEVFDPEGTRVLYLRGVSARIRTLSLLRSLARGRTVVELSALSVDDADVTVDENDRGELRLAQAFAAPIAAPAPTKTGSPAAPSTLEITIPSIRLGHAWVHGHTAAIPVVDVEVDDVWGGFTTTPTLTEVDLRKSRVHGRGIEGLDPDGRLAAHGRFDGSDDGRDLSANYDGRLGEIPVRAEVSLQGKTLAAMVDVPETNPEAFIATAPSRIRVRAPVTAHAEVRGTLPVLRPVLDLRIGGGTISVMGIVTLPEGVRTEINGSVRVHVQQLDVGLIDERAPSSTLTAEIDATVAASAGGRVSGTFGLENHVGRVGAQVVPAAHVNGVFTERSVRGQATIAEVGAPTKATFSFGQDGSFLSPSLLTFQVDTHIPDLDAVPRFGHVGRGAAYVEASGKLDLGRNRIDAGYTGGVTGLVVRGVALDDGFVAGSVTGPLDAPRFAGRVIGSGMRAGGYGFSGLCVTASGTAGEIDLWAKLTGDERAPTVTTSAHVSRGATPIVTNVRVRLERGEVVSTASVRTLSIGDRAVDLRGLLIEGLGEPLRADAQVFPNGAHVTVRTSDLDVHRVAVLLAREEGLVGHAAVALDVGVTHGVANGKLAVDAWDISDRGVDGASAHAEATVDGRRLQGRVSLSIAKLGQLAVDAKDLAIGGSLFDGSSWREATGSLALTGEMNLAEVLKRVPPSARPVASAEGTIDIRGNVSRGTRAEVPSVDLEASTSGLAVSGKAAVQTMADASSSLGPRPWSFIGIDGTVRVKLDGATGAAGVVAALRDKRGQVASFELAVTAPIVEILRNRSRALAIMRDLPISASFTVPRRPIENLPLISGLAPALALLAGDVELTAALGGTARAPALKVEAKISGLRSRRAHACDPALDIDANLAYDGAKASLRVVASDDGGARMTADASAHVDIARLMAPGPLEWQASTKIEFTGFPLETPATILGQEIGGRMSGSLVIDDLHQAARLAAKLELRDLSVNGSTIPTGNVDITLREGAFKAAVRLDQVDGYMDATADGAMSWGAQVVPSFDFASAVDLALHAKNFRVNVALPFLRDTFSELDGRIDTEAKLHIVQGGNDGSMDGVVTIREGVFEVPGIGERFHAVHGSATIKPWGTVRFDDFAAQGPTGSVTASGEAVLAGLSLRSAKATVHVAKDESLPIAVEGVPMGRAYGDVTATATMSSDARRLDVNVDIPTLGVVLPDSTGHSVQALDANENVRIGRYGGEGFVSIPITNVVAPRSAEKTAIRVALKLGTDVEIRRDTTLDLFVQGNVVVDITDKTRVTGQIRLVRGRFELQGKQFIVDKGLVNLTGAPSNPEIAATATWEAGDGTRVFADFTGTPDQGALVLRSEPALSQDEIVGLIMFGSADGSFGASAAQASPGSTAAQAVGLAGGAVTQGINKVISGVTTADIATRIDTSQAAGPEPEIAVQLTKTIQARIGYILGVPAPGDDPDRAHLTVDWRFIRNWSLAAVVGDQGSTVVDLVWRMHY